MPIFGPYFKKEVSDRPQYSAASNSVIYGFLWITLSSAGIYPDPTSPEKGDQTLKNEVRPGQKKAWDLVSWPSENAVSPHDKKPHWFIALQSATWGFGALVARRDLLQYAKGSSKNG